MNRVIGETSTKHEYVVCGEHHIIQSVPVADNESNIPLGCLLYEDSGKYKALAADDSTHAPVAVAVDELSGTASDAVIEAALHGTVRAEKLCFKDKSAATESTRAKLRSSGIYAIGALAADSSD